LWSNSFSGNYEKRLYKKPRLINLNETSSEKLYHGSLNPSPEDGGASILLLSDKEKPTEEYLVTIIQHYIFSRMNVINSENLLQELDRYGRLSAMPRTLIYARKILKIYDEFQTNLKLCSAVKVVEKALDLLDVLERAPVSIKEAFKPLHDKIGFLKKVRDSPLWVKQLSVARVAIDEGEYLSALILSREAILTYSCITLSTCGDKSCIKKGFCLNASMRDDIECYLMKLFFREFKPQTFEARLLSEAYGSVKTKVEKISKGLFSLRLKGKDVKKIVEEIYVKAVETVTREGLGGSFNYL